MRGEPHKNGASVGRRIIIVTVAVLAVSALVMGYLDARGRERILLRHLEQRGRLLAQTVSIVAVEAMLLSDNDYTTLETFVEELTDQEENAIYARIERVDGTTVCEAGDSTALGRRWVFFYREPILAPRIADKPPEKIGSAVLAFSTEQAAREIARGTRARTLEAVLGFVLVAMTLTWLLRRRVHAPLRSLAKQAEQLGAGALDAQIRLATNDEFGRLAATLETMRERLVRSYREIQEQNVRLMEVDELKSSFLATMSHEMRTPMNAILGFAELLERSDLDDEQRSMAETIRTSGSLLLRLIDDILDLSRIEANRVSLDAVPFDLGDVIHSVATLLEPEAERKRLEFRTDIAADVPVELIGDPLRLRQVVTNLAGNAIKFTDRGRVHLRVATEPPGRAATASDDGVTVRIEVEDTGIGLDERARARLFEPFFQADASTTRKYGGSGLGLAISKRLIETMRGEIGVESTLGRGSTFWFTVPLRHAAAPPATGAREPHCADGAAAANPGEVAEPIATDRRLLVVEDNPINQKLTLHALAKLGFAADLAADGEQAVHQVRCAYQPYAAILMDCQMPVMDGYTSTREIRRLGGDAGATPIIALTAHAMKGDREKCLDAGMDDYVAKPVRLEELRRVLSLWAGAGKRAASPLATP